MRRPKRSAPPAKGRTGPKPELYKIDGNWEDAVKVSLQKKKPATGWPKGNTSGLDVSMTEPHRPTPPRYAPHFKPTIDPPPPKSEWQRSAEIERRKMQQNLMTQTRFRFNFYSWYGRIFLLCYGCLGLLMVYWLVRMIGATRWPWKIDQWITFACAPFGIIALQLALWNIYWGQRRVYRLAHNLCPNCGYEVRASPDQCPECGRVPNCVK